MQLFIDSFLQESVAKDIRQQAINAKYYDWHGPDGQLYKRVCIIDSPDILNAIEGICGKVKMLGMAFRLNYEGEFPNQAIHSDVGWGTHALVYYLNDTQEDLGGTAFWKHKETGATEINPDDHELLDKIKDSWDNEDTWEMDKYVPMKFNRATIYESKLFHSRYPFDAFGSTPEDGRLVAVAFFTPVGEKMKRYNLHDNDGYLIHVVTDPNVVEDIDGEWVKYEDVVTLENSLNKIHNDKQTELVKTLAGIG